MNLHSHISWCYLLNPNQEGYDIADASLLLLLGTIQEKHNFFFFLTKEDGVLEMEKKMCLLMKNSDYILLLPILNQVLMQTVTVTACLHYFLKVLFISI